MGKQFIWFTMFLIGVASAQQSDIVEEDLPLPAPYEDTTGGTVVPQESPVISRTPSTHVIVTNIGRGSGGDISAIRKNARRGLGAYLAGFIMKYGAVLPMQLGAGQNNNEELYWTGFAISIVSEGLQIAGPIRAGVAASMAYDLARHENISADKNINWGFYRAGMAFKGINALVGVIVALSAQEMDYDTYATLSLISLASSIATDAMWMVSVINSAKYTKMVAGKTRHASLSVFPTYSLFTKSAGVGMRLSF